MSRKAGSLDLFLGDIFNVIASKVEPYARRVRERFEIMEAAKRTRMAPEIYWRMLRQISPNNPDDWRAGDVCFLEQYKNQPKVYQELLEVRELYFVCKKEQKQKLLELEKKYSVKR